MPPPAPVETTPLVPRPVATMRVAPPQPPVNVAPGSLEPPDPLGLDTSVHIVDATEAPARPATGAATRPAPARGAANIPAIASATPPPDAAVDTPTEAPAGAATYSVVLAKVDSESEARAQLSPLSKKYSSLLGARRLNYHREKSGGAYVWQVRTSGLNEADAEALCERITAAGGECNALPQ